MLNLKNTEFWWKQDWFRTLLGFMILFDQRQDALTKVCPVDTQWNHKKYIPCSRINFLLSASKWGKKGKLSKKAYFYQWMSWLVRIFTVNKSKGLNYWVLIEFTELCLCITNILILGWWVSGWMGGGGRWENGLMDGCKNSIMDYLPQ